MRGASCSEERPEPPPAPAAEPRELKAWPPLGPPPQSVDTSIPGWDHPGNWAQTEDDVFPSCAEDADPTGWQRFVYRWRDAWMCYQGNQRCKGVQVEPDHSESAVQADAWGHSTASQCEICPVVTDTTVEGLKRELRDYGLRTRGLRVDLEARVTEERVRRQGD